MQRGRLILVVGPSGAGKDSLISWCKARLAGDPAVIFPRRVITRADGDDSEAHEAVDEAGFAARLARGDFALHWRAHGLAYGIPRSVADDLAEGRTVVANVSRAVIAEARDRLAPVTVVTVTAPAALLAERLRRRDREATEAIAARLDRAAAYAVSGPDVVVLDNSGSLDAGGMALMGIIRGGRPLPATAGNQGGSHPDALAPIA
ncbi:MAG: phosphonate metabolism protein/1,5-bisphosphokinase (PRPP-forming) PhnN [Bauldia sp.]|nr:phosphonate metabolism protein/1,5-bisphosphokinase (PRPP-forming) PhnN [Bauldia sp.]